MSPNNNQHTQQNTEQVQQTLHVSNRRPRSRTMFSLSLTDARARTLGLNRHEHQQTVGFPHLYKRISPFYDDLGVLPDKVLFAEDEQRARALGRHAWDAH